MTTEKQCPVCLDDIGEKNSCVTECGHTFCLKCILRAAQENTACPMCRNVLVDEPENTHSPEDIENYMTEYIEEYMAEDLEAAYARGCDEGREWGQSDGYDVGWGEAAQEFQEEIRRLKGELKKFKPSKQPKTPKQPRPQAAYMYFKNHSDNQQSITEASAEINEDTGRPIGKVKGAGIVWGQLSDEEKEMWKQRSIADFKANIEHLHAV